MSIVTTEAHLFKTLVSILNEVSFDGYFTFSDQGLSIGSVNKNNDVFMKVILDHDSFKSLKGELVVNIDRLKDLISHIRKNNILTITIEKEYLVLKTEPKTVITKIKTLNKCFYRILVSLNDTKWDIAVESSEFFQVCKDLKSHGRTVVMEVIGQGLRMTTDCGIFSKEYNLGITGKDVSYSGVYDIDSISRFLNLKSVSKSLKLSFFSSNIMRISGKTQIGTVEVYIKSEIKVNL